MEPLQLPAKRVIEGEVVIPVSAFTITITVPGVCKYYDGLKETQEKIRKLERSTGRVRRILPFEKLDDGAIDILPDGKS